MDEKLYYSISEVAEKFNLAQSKIRFWETEFPSYIKPKRNKRGVRFFTAKDIENIEKIYNLVEKEKYTLEGARKALKSTPKSIKKDLPQNVETQKPQLENITEVQNQNLADKNLMFYEKLNKIKELTEKLLSE